MLDGRAIALRLLELLGDVAEAGFLDHSDLLLLDLLDHEHVARHAGVEHLVVLALAPHPGSLALVLEEVEGLALPLCSDRVSGDMHLREMNGMAFSFFHQSSETTTVSSTIPHSATAKRCLFAWAIMAWSLAS